MTDQVTLVMYQGKFEWYITSRVIKDKQISIRTTKIRFGGRAEDTSNSDYIVPKYPQIGNMKKLLPASITLQIPKQTAIWWQAFDPPPVPRGIYWPWKLEIYSSNIHVSPTLIILCYFAQPIYSSCLKNQQVRRSCLRDNQPKFFAWLVFAS